MEEVAKYFNAEKYESLLFILIGIIAISLSAYFIIKIKQPFYMGISYPFIAVALLQLIVGTSVYFRSPKDIIRVNQIIQVSPTNIVSEEVPRMKVVMEKFILYRWIEIVLMVMGIILFLYFKPNAFLKGVGLGLFIQSSIMLSLDYFAENRGKTYLEFLQGLQF
jgi:hypothetical protein